MRSHISGQDSDSTTGLLAQILPLTPGISPGVHGGALAMELVRRDGREPDPSSHPPKSLWIQREDTDRVKASGV